MEVDYLTHFLVPLDKPVSAPISPTQSYFSHLTSLLHFHSDHLHIQLQSLLHFHYDHLHIQLQDLVTSHLQFALHDDDIVNNQELFGLAFELYLTLQEISIVAKETTGRCVCVAYSYVSGV